MRRPLIIGAHKLFMSLDGAIAFARQIRTTAHVQELEVEAVVSPSLINLAHVAGVLADAGIGVAAQTFHQEHRGAHTGQVSLEELVQLGVRYVILGHKELAAHHADQTPAVLGAKLPACLRRGIAPIVFCPDLPDDASDAEETVACHLAACLGVAVREHLSLRDVVIAYEPAWLPAGGDMFESAAWRDSTSRNLDTIRASVAARFGEAAAGLRLVYGGGVSEPLVTRLLKELDVDGLLIGRASTDAASFVRILQAAHQAVTVSTPQGLASPMSGAQTAACREPR